MPRFGNQKAVARTLGITDRRVRQLEAEHIIPSPNENGRYDIQRCEEFFDLYSANDPALWEEFHADLLRRSMVVEHLVNDGPGSPQTVEAIRAASIKLQDLFARLRLSLACHQRTDDFPRRCMLEKFEREENEGLSRLLARGIGILSAERGISPEAGLAQLDADCA